MGLRVIIFIACAAVIGAGPAAAQRTAEAPSVSTPAGIPNIEIDRILERIEFPNGKGGWNPGDTKPRRSSRKLPGGLGTIPLPSLLPEDPDGVAAWVKRREQVQIPAAPGTSADNLAPTAALHRRTCSSGGGHCDLANAFEGVVGALRAASSKNLGCDAAAKAYAASYTVAEPSAEVARDFDVGCLGSLSPRLVGTAAVAPDPIPGPFTGGPDGSGALSAVGLLEVDGRTRFCAGLLRNDRTLVTARHCLDGYRIAYDENRVTVRSAAGGQSWPVEPPAPETREPSQLVKDDWIVLRLGGSSPIAVAETVLGKFGVAEALTIVAPYSHADLVTYSDKADEWRQSLRYPRAGMCHGLVEQRGCLVLTCQTVAGFSGAPIFKTDASVPRPTVVGFVSQILNATSGCPAMGPFPTLAVSADKIPR